MRRFLIAGALALGIVGSAMGQTPPKPEDTEQWTPVPPIVTPGLRDSAPPSDAIVLFDGKNLDQWVTTRDKSPAKWVVADGVLVVSKTGGNIETKRHFRNYQLHIEWRVPTNITGSGQARATAASSSLRRALATPATRCRSWTRIRTRPT